MKILVIGDIFGRPGRNATKRAILELKEEQSFDLIIANGENMAHGSGITKRTYDEMMEAGVDFFTSGNHIYKKPDIFPEMEKPDTLIIRPANYPPGNVGIGHQVINNNGKQILIINLIGRVFMGRDFDCPFRAVDSILEDYKEIALDAILVDFHAEVSSEKIAMRHYLEGRVSALWGTHTHIPTADAEIGSMGMAYITDIGMVGPKDSIIGAEKTSIINSFLMQTSFKLEPASGRCVFNAIVLEILSRSESSSIQLIQKEIDE